MRQLIKNKYKVLMLSTLINHLSTHVVIVILPIYLLEKLHFSIYEIGIILTVNQLAILLGSIIAGLILNCRFKHLTIFFGSLVQAIAIFTYIPFKIFIALLIITIFSGLGHGISNAAIKTAIQKEAKNGNDSTSLFSTRGVYANWGLLLGGLIILIFYQFNHHIIFYIASGFFFLLSFILILSINQIKEDKINNRIRLFDLIKVLVFKRLWLFLIIILTVNLAYAQLIFLLPLKADKVLSHVSFLGLILIISNLEVIILQKFISKKVVYKLHYLITLSLALIFFSGGIYLLGISKNFYYLTICSLVFTVGQMLITPTIDVAIGKFSNEKNHHFSYSWATFAQGIGAMSGTYLSSTLFNYFGINNLTSYTIVTFTILGFIPLLIYIKKTQLIKI